MSRKIVLAGATGFVGRELGKQLALAGYELHVVSRRSAAVAQRLPFPCTLCAWDDPGALTAACEGALAIVNLCGAGIGEGRWTAKRRQVLLQSRQEPIRLLAAALAACRQKPEVWVQASAVGYYGDTGEQGEAATEASQNGQGFLAETCRLWEGATAAIDQSLRLVILRIGVVLGAGGGFLGTLGPLYAARVGALPGSGQQWFSFIHRSDLCRMITTAITDQRWQGIVNAVSPKPCRFQAVHVRLATAFGRSPLPPVPAFALRGLMGDMASLALDSCRVLPSKASAYGFSWDFPDIDVALAAIYDLPGSVTAHHGLVFSDGLWLPGRPDAVWAFFSDEKNLERITPPWLKFAVLGKSAAALGPGVTIDYQLALHGIPLRWRTLLAKWEPGREFVDMQQKGPYALWYHRHSFTPLPDGQGVIAEDRVDFRLPLHPLAYLVAGRWVQNDVAKIFAYRKEVLASTFPLRADA